MSAVADSRQALVIANDVRYSTARFRELMRSSVAGNERLRIAADMIEQRPESLGSMQVFQFLLTLPQVGPEFVRRFFMGTMLGRSIYPLAHVADLTTRQREGIAVVLRERADDRARRGFGL